ncbi:hypothetical protein ES703_77911 [subsurface metagenome]
MKYLSLFLILFLLCLSCELTGPSGPTIYNVEYEVTGFPPNKVDVTFENESGGTSQYSNVSIPWSYSFEREEGEFVYISAQNQGESGSITVTIYKNNNILKSSTSSGAYVIATASGTL